MIEHFLWGILFMSLVIFNYEINHALHRKTLEEKESFARIWNHLLLQANVAKKEKDTQKETK